MCCLLASLSLDSLQLIPLRVRRGRCGIVVVLPSLGLVMNPYEPPNDDDDRPRVPTWLDELIVTQPMSVLVVVLIGVGFVIAATVTAIAQPF